MKGFTEYSGCMHFLRSYETHCYYGTVGNLLEGMESVGGNLLADMDILFISALKKTFGDDASQFNTYFAFLKNILALESPIQGVKHQHMHYFFRPTGDWLNGGKLYVANEGNKQLAGARYCLQHVLRSLFFHHPIMHLHGRRGISKATNARIMEQHFAVDASGRKPEPRQIGANEVKRIYDTIRRHVVELQIEGVE